MKFDFRKLSDDELVEYITMTSTQPHFLNGKKDDLRDLFVLEQDKLHGKFKGIIIFVTVIHSENVEAGFSWVIPRENNVVMIPDGIFNGQIYLHEAAHSLGLEHTFSETDANKVNIGICERNNESYKNGIANYKESNAKRENFILKFKDRKPTDIITFKDGNKKSVGEIREENLAKIESLKIKIKELEEKLEKGKTRLNDYKVVSNKYFFDQATTDNIMDYPENEDKSVRNPHGINNVFHKYQWLIIQEGVKIVLK